MILETYNLGSEKNVYVIALFIYKYKCQNIYCTSSFDINSNFFQSNQSI